MLVWLSYEIQERVRLVLFHVFILAHSIFLSSRRKQNQMFALTEFCAVWKNSLQFLGKTFSFGQALNCTGNTKLDAHEWGWCFEVERLLGKKQPALVGSNAAEKLSSAWFKRGGCSTTITGLKGLILSGPGHCVSNKKWKCIFGKQNQNLLSVGIYR